MGEARRSATLFTGGRIHTMDAAHGEVEALLVVDGRIAAVGARDAVLATLLAGGAAPDAPDGPDGGPAEVDLLGRTLVPGFIDAHCHPSIVALSPRWADCGGATAVEHVHAVLADQAAREPAAEWVRGFGWDEAAGLRLTRHDLDALGLDRPVVVCDRTVHRCVVSSLALDLLGIGRTTGADGTTGGWDDHGYVERAPDGEPTGVLIETAWGEVHRRSLASYLDPDRWGDLIVDHLRARLAEGVTAVHDAAVDPDAEARYASLHRQGRLPVSVLAMPHPSVLFSEDVGDRLDGPPTGEGDEWLRVGPVKLFADGGVGPAIDVHYGSHRITFGHLFAGTPAGIVAAVARGFRVGVHAIGNLGVQAALDAFAEAARARPDDDHRFRVEHVGLATRDQVDAMRALGAVGVVQPGFVDHMGEQSGGFWPDDAAWLPFAWLAEAGVPLAASSDDPCAGRAPLPCAAYGAHRHTHTGRLFGPDQAVPFADWLHAYTAGAAYAGGQEHERGRLVPGLRADLVVLDGPLLADPVPTVAETWVAGERVHRRDAPR